MRSHARVIQIGVIVTAALLFIATTVKSQAPAAPAQVWEYNSVTGFPLTYVSPTNTGINSVTFPSSARVCYATPQGCRTEEVTATVPSKAMADQALMIAAAKLGEQGWELTSSTEILDTSGNEQTLYFRRLKKDSK